MSTPDTPHAADTPGLDGMAGRPDSAPAPAVPAPARRAPAVLPGGSGGSGAAEGGSGRLRNGELRRMVAGYLADHPGLELTPGEIARALGRSSGAVGNALALLARGSAAERVCEKPVRYRATRDTAAAAVGGSAPSARAVATRSGAGGTSGRSGSASTPTASGAATGSTAAGGSAAARSVGFAAGPAAGSAADSAAGAAPAAALEPVTGPVPRPNGQMYHPRQLSGLPDVTALRKLRAAGVPALLYGSPGTGKTSVVEAAFPDLVTVQGDGDTTVADLVGEYTQTPDGRYVFVHGPLVIAMREGRALFLDDATLIPPTVLAVVYPAMDGRREIVIKANGGEVVRAAEGFYVVAGRNPGVHGEVLTDALASRFSAQIHVTTDYELASQLKIDPRAVRVARNLATRQTRGEVGWAPQLRELIAYQRIADVLGRESAAGNLIGIAPEEDRDTVAAAVRAAFGAEMAPLALGTQIKT